MKIIGQTGDGRMLVDASLDELTQLTGYNGTRYRERDGKKKLQVGDEIDVNTLYAHAAHMKTISEQIAKAKGILDTVSGGLTLADNVIQKAMEKSEERTKVVE